jgi:hypothetical protein
MNADKIHSFRVMCRGDVDRRLGLVAFALLQVGTGRAGIWMLRAKHALAALQRAAAERQGRGGNVPAVGIACFCSPPAE